MRTLFFGAGPLASVYAHLFLQAGADVTVLARGERYDWLQKNGLILVNEVTGEQGSSPVDVVNELKPRDAYDLVIVLIRKNKLPPVFEILAANPNIENILFIGNNARGFDQYLKHLPAEKMLFGFPGAGGGIREQIVHYADREGPKKKRRSVTIGEMDGLVKERTLAVKSLFESAGVPADLTVDIDSWLKYHAALVIPLACALYKHNCDNYQAANDKEVLRAMVRSAREGGRVLRALGFRKRQPFEFNLFYWLPEFMSMMAVGRLLRSKFAEVAFAMHARAAREEMKDLARELQEISTNTSVETPNMDRLRSFIE